MMHFTPQRGTMLIVFVQSLWHCVNIKTSTRSRLRHDLGRKCKAELKPMRRAAEGFEAKERWRTEEKCA